MKLNRNDPCHCGSGKKYKKCHLNSDEARARQERSMRTLAEWVAYHRVGLEQTIQAQGDDAVARQIALFDGDPPAIVAADPSASSNPERVTGLRAALAESHLSLNEVVECKPGKGLRFRDRLAEETRWVGDPELAKVLEPMEVVLGRVMRFEEKHVLLEGWEKVYFRGRKAAVADLSAQVQAAVPAAEATGDEEADAEADKAVIAARIAWLKANGPTVMERARAAAP